MAATSTLDTGLLVEAARHLVRSGAVSRRGLQHALRVDAATTALVIGRLQQLDILTPGPGRTATGINWQRDTDTLTWATQTITSSTN